jgi:hypothetical protein
MIIVFIALLIFGFFVIKLWVKIVSYLFRPLERAKEQKNQSNFIRVLQTPKKKTLLNYTAPKNDIVDMQISHIQKNDTNFTAHIKVINLTDKPIFYKLGECYYITSEYSQIKGNTAILVELFSKNNNRILPYLNELRGVSFQNDYTVFSDTDTLVCEVIVNGISYLISTMLKDSGIKTVELSSR